MAQATDSNSRESRVDTLISLSLSVNAALENVRVLAEQLGVDNVRPEEKVDAALENVRVLAEHFGVDGIREEKVEDLKARPKPPMKLITALDNIPSKVREATSEIAATLDRIRDSIL